MRLRAQSLKLQAPPPFLSNGVNEKPANKNQNQLTKVEKTEFENKKRGLGEQWLKEEKEQKNETKKENEKKKKMGKEDLQIARAADISVTLLSVSV